MRICFLLEQATVQCRNMKPTILVLQFRRNPMNIAMEQASLRREIEDTIKLVYVSALDTTILWDQPVDLLAPYHGVILGGSGDFDFDGGRFDADDAKCMSYTLLERLSPLLEYIFDHDVPTLGICYGHQILGAFAGAAVTHDTTQKKTRSHHVEVIREQADSGLFIGVPDTFYAHYGHKDSLDRVPIGAELLVSGGEACKVSALRYKQNIYTTQFHPELTFDDMLLRMEAVPDYLPPGIKAEEIFMRDTHSNLIVRNFGRLVVVLAEGS